MVFVLVLMTLDPVGDKPPQRLGKVAAAKESLSLHATKNLKLTCFCSPVSQSGSKLQNSGFEAPEGLQNTDLHVL